MNTPASLWPLWMQNMEVAAHSPLRALRLITPEVRRGNSAALVNAALTFAFCLGTDKDWQIADALMKNLPLVDASRIQSRWGVSLHAPDTENLLVHYFLLRHHKIKKSSYGLMEDISDQLTAAIPTFPDWLKTKPRFHSLAEVFTLFLDDDFEDYLTSYLARMPRSRASAEELMHEMGQWDEWLLYQAALTDFSSYLTPSELRAIMLAYPKKFFIPLSSITDRPIPEDTTEKAP